MSIGLYIVLAPLYLKSVRKLQEKRFVFVKILAIIIPENGAKVSKIKCFQFAQQTLNTVNITFNHNRSLEGNWTKTGELKIIESTLNEKETELLRQNEKVIREASQELLAIHNSVYDY